MTGVAGSVPADRGAGGGGGGGEWVASSSRSAFSSAQTLSSTLGLIRQKYSFIRTSCLLSVDAESRSEKGGGGGWPPCLLSVGRLGLTPLVVGSTCSLIMRRTSCRCKR